MGSSPEGAVMIMMQQVMLAPLVRCPYVPRRGDNVRSWPLERGQLTAGARVVLPAECVGMADWQLAE
jgi:hypothetical protein